MKKQPSPYFKGDNFPAFNREAPLKVTEGVNTFRIETPQYLERMVEVLSEESILAIDTETNGLNAYSSNLFLIQIASSTKCFIIRVESFPDTDYLYNTIRPILEDESKLKLLQNAKFDYKMLRAKGNISMNNIFDTMLAERLLTAGTKQEVNLAFIANKYLDKHLDKRVRASFIGLQSLGHISQSQLEYAADDVFTLFGIYKRQLPLLAEQNLLPVADLEFNCIPVVAEMELAGIKIDVPKWEEIIKLAEEKKTELQAEVMALMPSGKVFQATMFGSPIYDLNVNSSPQLIKDFKKLGIDLPDTSEKTLKNNKSRHPAIAKILDYRKQEKIISSFGLELLKKIDSYTGRIHPEFKQYGANTGRFSSENPNVQQIPSDSSFRECFVARPGYKMVVCDYSACELRILGQLSQDKLFLEYFNADADLHTMTAANVYKVKPEEVTKDMRKKAKFVSFGLVYGIGSKGLSELVECSIEEAESLLKAYFDSFSGVDKWLEKTARDAVKNKYTTTPMGRKLYFQVPDKSDIKYKQKISRIERQAKNAPIQGANADFSKAALIFLSRRLKNEKLDARIVNCVHDEIVVEVKEEQAEYVKCIVEEEMLRAEGMVITDLPCKAEAVIADCWTK